MRWQRIVAAIVLLWCVAVFGGDDTTSSTEAVQSITSIAADPRSVSDGTPTTVTVTVQSAQDPRLIRNSVILQQLDQQGKIIGSQPLYDDSTHGDLHTGDNLFTTQLVLNETGPKLLRFRASAAYLKQVRRVSSPTLAIPVHPTVILFSNPADRNLTQVTAPDGRIVVYIGTKDASGVPAQVTEAKVDAADGNPAYRSRITFDALGRPVQGVLPNNDMLTLEYRAVNQVLITVRAAGSGAHTTVTYDPTMGTVSPQMTTSLPASVTLHSASVAPRDVTTTSTASPGHSRWSFNSDVWWPHPAGRRGANCVWYIYRFQGTWCRPALG